MRGAIVVDGSKHGALQSDRLHIWWQRSELQFTSGSASVTNGTGSVAGSPSFAANTMTVTLTVVTDVQKITVTLSNVTDSFAQVLPNTAVSMNVLIGDVTGNKTVNGTDVSQTKIQAGTVVLHANFREDVNITNSINSSDVSLVKSRSGFGVP